MGAKDWMLFYANGEIRPILQATPALDRAATHALVKRLYPSHWIAPVEDGTLLEQGGPPSRVWGWRGPTSSPVWRETPICKGCQDKIPEDLFPPEVKADPGEAWGR